MKFQTVICTTRRITGLRLVLPKGSNKVSQIHFNIILPATSSKLYWILFLLYFFYQYSV
jgi:hypothetical protein